MRPAVIIELVGNAWRPFAGIFLTICLGTSLFFAWVNGAAQALVATALGALIAARSWENTVTTKTGADVQKTATMAGTSGGGLSTVSVVTPTTTATSSTPAPPPKKGK